MFVVAYLYFISDGRDVLDNFLEFCGDLVCLFAGHVEHHRSTYVTEHIVHSEGECGIHFHNFVD